LGTFLIVVVIFFVAMFFYDMARKKNKIYCTFRTPQKTREEKFVSAKSKYVIWRGGRYKINPKKITTTWWDRGLLGALKIGYWVQTLDFTWWTDQPLDPDNFEVTWDTPEVRNMLSSEEDYLDFAKHAAPTSGKKESGLQRMLPWIMLGVVVILGYLIFQMRGDIAALYQLIQVK
jgi:hypothetical protein